MKIGICGAESTGKTTLAKALAEELGLPLITEQARTVAQEMGITDLNKEYPKYLWDRFQWRCLEAQIAAELEHRDFVSDRTVLDNLAYWLVDHAIPEGQIETLRYWVRVTERLQTKPYDLVVLVRPGRTKLDNDGFRHTNPGHREIMDYTICSLVGWAMYMHTDLMVVDVQGATEQRLKQVKDAIRVLERTGEIANVG